MRRQVKVPTVGSEELRKWRRLARPAAVFVVIVASVALLTGLASAATPAVVTEPASNLLRANATLHGTVNPEGEELTECVFEYGTTTGYGKTAACEETPAQIGAGSSPVSVQVRLANLEPATEYHFRLSAVNATSPKSSGADETFSTVGVLTEAASNVTKTDATLHGAVNPEGAELTECVFEYGTTTGYGKTAACVETPAQIGAGTSPVSVHAELTGLGPATEYHFRLSAVNATSSKSSGSDKTFATLGPLPTGEVASLVQDTSAKLSGSVNPNGKLTTYHFEYTDEADFQAHGFADATRTPVPDAAAGGGSISVPVSVALAGLTPATTYHFRIVATNPDGSAGGSGATFTTYPAAPAFAACPNDSLRYGYGAYLPDCRAYEQATPIEKDGTNPKSAWFAVQAAENGSGVTFFSQAGIPGADGAGSLPTFASFRGAAGWTTRGLLPPATAGERGSVFGWTPDLAEWFNTVTRFGTGTGAFTRTGSDNAFHPIAPFISANRPEYNFVGASSDGSEVYIEASGLELTPDAAPEKQNLYVWNRETGVLSLVGVLPDSACGAPPCTPPGGSFGGSYNWWTNELSAFGGAEGRFFTQYQHAISSDGAKAYFTAGETGQLYLRENATSPAATTVRVSASQKTNGTGPGGSDPEGPGPAAFLFATADGSRAFFSSHEELTNDANTGEVTIGRANLDGTGADQRLTPAGSSAGLAVDGSHVYWAEPKLDAIGRANLDGSGTNEEFITGADNPQGVAVDGGHVYWTNAAGGADGEGTIGRANLDGSGTNEDFITGANNPQGIAVDAEHVYWANQGSAAATSAIARAKLDGTEVNQSFVAVGGAGNPGGVAVDSTYIYYTSPAYQRIGRVNLDGTGNDQFFLYTGAGSEPGSVAVDAGHIYWPDQSENSIARANLDGTGMTRKFVAGATNPHGIAVDGAHVYWSNQAADTGNDLYRYEAGSGELTDLTPDASDFHGAEVQGVVGISADGSYVYFAANGDLDGAGPAAAGDCQHLGGVSNRGECSLYLWHEGHISFVARLDASGTVGGIVGPGRSDLINWVPTGREGSDTLLNGGRVSADGQVVLFRSQRKLTAYDNHGVPEFYRYDARSKALDCVTCNPSGLAPTGQPNFQARTAFVVVGSWAGITTRNLSSSGDRIFFETPDALLPGDTNGVEDVYEWEADGSGSCQSTAENGGCLYLLSTGKSPEASHLADASVSGDDVFIFTDQPLVGQDEDELVDIYDARVDGGLASQNSQRVPPCSGEGCRGSSTKASGTAGAGTSVFSGPGNQVPGGACIATRKIGRLHRHAATLRHRSRALTRRARHTGDAQQARRLKRQARRLSKGAQVLTRRAHGLAKRCKGAGSHHQRGSHRRGGSR